MNSDRIEKRTSYREAWKLHCHDYEIRRGRKCPLTLGKFIAQRKKAKQTSE